MATPSLRILIVDNQHLQRLGLEKILNLQGYYRIAPVATFEELLLIVQNAVEPFDLVLINRMLVTDTAFNLDDFCHHCPSVRHALIYDGQVSPSRKSVVEGGAKIIQKITCIPDETSIKKLVQLIDPPRKKVCVDLRCTAFLRLTRCLGFKQGPVGGDE